VSSARATASGRISRPNVAYFADKVARGYDRFINVLGADHHGYVSRLRNALTALGLSEDRFEALLYQLVFITSGGVAVKSSKRAGNVVTVDEIMDEIDDAAGRKGAAADALRFFFLSRSAHSNVEFDIELAKKDTVDNPVFYVQYGYARLRSIQQDLAQHFQSHFTRLKADNDPILPWASTHGRAGWESSWNGAKTRARLAWIEAIRLTYAAALGLVGVTAPERLDRRIADDVPDDDV
jgi:arginyl-tRNA synthetase